MERNSGAKLTPLENQGIATGISQARALESTLRAYIEAEKEAAHDELTGALNRRGFKRWLESAKAPKAMLLIDATNLKAINDRYGENTGDLVIMVTYQLLRDSVRDRDVVARWGGDEFVIALNDVDEIKAIGAADTDRRTGRVQVEHIDPVKKRVAENLNTFLAEHPDLNELNFDLAVGSVVWPGQADISTLIEEAEKEMRSHKAQQHQAGKYRAS